MVYRLIVVAISLSAICSPSFGLESPTPWRDSDTGCAYLLTPQGGVSPRLRRDGVPDCPDASTASRRVDDTVRGISRGLEALQRELERLRERFRNESSPERLGERL